MAGSFYKTEKIGDGGMGIDQDQRLFAPAAGRNMDVIANVIVDFLPEKGHAMEIACGSGQHINRFSSLNRSIEWHPTDIELAHLQSVDAHARIDKNENVRPAMHLNVLDDVWSIEKVDFIYNANLIHISPWVCTEALMKGVARTLNENGKLFMYGPYQRNGNHTSEGNEKFDQSLKSNNPEWGVRHLEDVVEVAAKNGLKLFEIIEMPANNLAVIYKMK